MHCNENDVQACLNSEKRCPRRSLLHHLSELMMKIKQILVLEETALVWFTHISQVYWVFWSTGQDTWTTLMSTVRPIIYFQNIRNQEICWLDNKQTPIQRWLMITIKRLTFELCRRRSMFGWLSSFQPHLEMTEHWRSLPNVDQM